MTLRRFLVPTACMVLGLFQAFDAMALGLARARGAVLIGRPLNVTIAATTEPGDPDVPCVEADVFQGDTRVNARRVSARWEPGQGGAGSIRVTTEGVVEEPVVTIYLRVGCANKVTRRYVLLSEEPMETDSASPASVQATPLPQRATAPTQGLPSRASSVPASPPSTVTASPAPARAAANVPSADPLRIQPAQRIAPRSQAAPVQRRERAAPRADTGATRTARLKLDPLDLAPEREPSLRTSERLQHEPVADEERRRQAAAMWKALSAGPEEAMRNSERLQALERDVRSLHDLMRKNTAALELMRDQTLKARGERNLMSILAIGLALLVAAVAVAWAWRSRAQPSAAWWGRRRSQVDSEFPSELQPSRPPARRPASAAAPLTSQPDIDLAEPVSQAPVSVPLSSPPRASHSTPRFSASSRFQVSDFQASVPGSSRMMKAEELIDIQQQADFFLSIDQPERAIALLESHIQQESETSALAWMDLLEIYHDLGREEDYERIREGFHTRFNAHVPAFEADRHEQAGLENYGRALTRIVSLWPSRRVLDVIEESLLRKPGTADNEAFNLEAYRELVLLYNIGREIAQDAEEPSVSLPRVSEFGDTNVMSLSELQAAARAPVESMSPSEMPWPSENLGLDIDLGDFSSLPAAPAPSVAPAEKKPPDEPATDLDSLDWRSLR